MDIINIAVFAAFIINLIYTIVLHHYYYHPPQRSRSLYYFRFVSLAVSLWCISMFLFRLVSADYSILFAKILYMSASFIPSLFLLFCLAFPNQKIKKWQIISVLFLNAAIAALCILDKFTISKVFAPVNKEKIIEFAMPGYLLYFVYIPSLFVISFIVLLKKQIKSVGIEKAQLTFIFTGSFITSNVAMFTNLLLPTLKIFDLNWAGQVVTVIWISFVSYAVLRYRLFGIKVILGKLLYFALKAAIYFFSFYLIYIIQTLIWGSIFSTGAIVSGIGIAISYIFAFQKIDDTISRFLKRVLIYSEYNPLKYIEKLLKETSVELNPDKVAAHVLDIIKSALGVKKLGIVVIQERDNNVSCIKLIGFKNDVISDLRKILEMELFKDQVKPFIYEELKLSGGSNNKTEESEKLEKVLKFMETNEVAVLFPLVQKPKLNGFLLIGNKPHNDAFTVEDINFLENVVANVSVALGRALLYAEVQKFSYKLQEEVEEATKKLRIQNEKLKRIDKLKDDLISIAGHELRSPLTLAKGNLELLKAKFDLPEREKRLQYLERALDSISREAELVTILLEASRIEQNRLDLEIEKVQLEEVAEKACDEYRDDAMRKGLKLIFEKPKKPLPAIFGDRTRLREVIDNLLSNAVKYTEKGYIKVWLEHKNENVYFYIEDTGIGIPKKELPKLFQKFYRVQTYTSSEKKLLRPGGTGLGLYVSRNIVRRHGGEIFVKSELGKGSTFWFYIPLSFKGKLGEVKTFPREKVEPDMFRRLGLAKKGKT